MSHRFHPELSVRPAPWLLLAVMAAGVSLASCSKLHQAGFTPPDKASVGFQDAQSFPDRNLTDAETQEMAAARAGGISEQTCVELIRLAHERNQPFADGHAAAALVAAGMRESSVLELARLNQLGLQSGEAQAMSLAHLSDRVILAIAQRRAAGMPTLSGSTAAALQNSGFNEEQILAEITRGTTDDDANAMIARRNAAAAKQVVRQPRRRANLAPQSAWGR